MCCGICILKWILKNSLAVLFMFTSVCLLIAVVVLASENAKLSAHKKDASALSSIHKEKMLRFKDKLNYRLPRNVVPKNYKLLLKPHPTNMTFTGHVVIEVEVKTLSNQITLHSKDLNIVDVGLKNSSKTIALASKLKSDNRLETIQLNTKDKLLPGLHWIAFKFTGRLDHKLVGLYASKLKNNQLMVASKFEPTYARQAFPCFDEPDLKATYEIRLVKANNKIALSNMNVLSTTPNKDKQTEIVAFAKSVPMSTYLACFVICDFGYKENVIETNGVGNNFVLRSYGQKNNLQRIDFSHDIGIRATKFYINYYQVAFPLPKLDMIAIADYISGATEHWGLITFRETSFLIDKKTASVQNQMSVANTVAHEIAHMWFGNLVTMKWWNDIWLNEGFATYMQSKCLNTIEPTWKVADYFLTKVMHSMLARDAKLSSRPIVYEVSTPDQITAIFDAVSYSKGSSILRMLEGFVGDQNFRHGITDYLKKFEFKNTVTRDLYDCLHVYFIKDFPELSIQHIMDTWTKQMGYPVVTVARSTKPNSFVLTQTRFLIDPTAQSASDSPFDYRWFIPITYKTNLGMNKKILWFPDNVPEVKLTFDDDVKWLKINNNEVGYYRVNYPTDMWKQLIQQLKSKSPELTISDRAHLINEIFALASAQVVPYDLALSLTTYLVVEEDSVPWEAAESVFAGLCNKLQHTSAIDDLMKYVQKLVTPVYLNQSWVHTPTSINKRLVRTKILFLAVKYEIHHALDKAQALLLQWLDAPNRVTIEPDLRDFVYHFGMTHASQEVWDKMWAIYMKEDDPIELVKIRSALAAPQNEAILAKYLFLAWDEKNVRTQDFLTVLEDISANPVGTDLVWKEVRARWRDLVDRFSINSRYLGGMIPAITSSFNTDAKLKEMEAFFNQYPEAGAGEAARRNALETVRNNIQWARNFQPVVVQWLQTEGRQAS